MIYLVTIIQYFSGIIGLIGTYLIIIGYDRYTIYKKIRKRGILTEGIVTELIESSDFVDGFVFGGKSPVVEFSTTNGQYSYRSTTYQNPTPYKVRQKVKIWYLFGSSRRDMALEDDVPSKGSLQLIKGGIALCLFSYPFLLYSIYNFYFGVNNYQ